jgi:flagellar biosynthetic protein FliQ
MTEQFVIDIGVDTLWLAIKLAAPALFAAMAIGLIVSILQAATQIQEQTLQFVPKVLGITIAVAISGPWLISQFLDFTTQMFASIPDIMR